MKDSEWIENLKQANWVELQILRWYQLKKGAKTAKFPSKPQVGYDIEYPVVGNIEVKEDRMAVSTGNYAIEIEDASGKPSGIEATTAGMFIIVDNEYVVEITTNTLKNLIKETDDKKQVNMGFTTQEGKQATGWLIPRNTILLSPYANVTERWFKTS